MDGGYSLGPLDDDHGWLATDSENDYSDDDDDDIFSSSQDSSSSSSAHGIRRSSSDDLASDTSEIDSSDYPSSSSSQDNSSQEKLYGGAPTKSQLVRFDLLRLQKKRQRLEVPCTPSKRQASNGFVKAFVPDVYGQCCKRRCCKHFDDPKDPLLVSARKPLFDTTISRPEMRARLMRNAVDLLRNADDGKPVCTKMACIAYTCSTSFLLPNTKRSKGTQGDANRRRSKILYSVMSWFNKEKELCDVMPDTGKYLLTYPRKVAVYERYMADCEEVTACAVCEHGRNPAARGPCGCKHATKLYLHCAEDYFLTLWKQHFANCQIRKHQRFSKCTFCVRERTARNNRDKDQVLRQEAKRKLAGHYDWVHRERGEEINKVRVCVCVCVFC